MAQSCKSVIERKDSHRRDAEEIAECAEIILKFKELLRDLWHRHRADFVPDRRMDALKLLDGDALRVQVIVDQLDLRFRTDQSDVLRRRSDHRMQRLTIMTMAARDDHDVGAFVDRELLQLRLNIADDPLLCERKPRFG